MIVEDPHPALYTKSRPVEPDEYKEVKKLAQKALKQLIHVNKTQERGGVGLAANQIGDTRRWFVGQVFKIVINPVIHKVSAETATMEEGCLSLPGYKRMVKRPAVIEVSWRDGKGKTHMRVLDGLSARIFQHEYDHLDGINIFGQGRGKDQQLDAEVVEGLKK